MTSARPQPAASERNRAAANALADALLESVIASGVSDEDLVDALCLVAVRRLGPRAALAAFCSLLMGAVVLEGRIRPESAPGAP